MIHTPSTSLLAAGALVLLTACDRPPSLGPGEVLFGNAVLHNIAVQTVAEAPPTDVGILSHSGRRAAAAVRAYESGEVERPTDIVTTDVIATSGD